MYQIGDYVVYGGSGVCQVMAVGTPASSACDRHRAYYTLRPLASTETIYVPVDTHVSIRPVLTRQEADALILQLPGLPECPVDTKNPQLRSHAYQESFRANDSAELARLLTTTRTRTPAGPGGSPGRWTPATGNGRRNCSTGSSPWQWASPRTACPNIFTKS